MNLKSVTASIQARCTGRTIGIPEEIAHAVMYLASDEAAFVVGSELMIDGGLGRI